mgnify:CR=1 FL=1
MPAPYGRGITLGRMLIASPLNGLQNEVARQVKA